MPRSWDGLTVYTREDWGAPGPSAADVDEKPKRLMVVHHSAFRGMAVDTLAEQKACMRSMFRFHTEERRWKDIAYNLIVFQPSRPGLAARVFTGRGVNRVPAAQSDANAGTVAVCVVQLDEAIKTGTVQRLKSIYKRLDDATDVRGHRQVGTTRTDCPGDALMRILGDLRAVK